jgi:UDP-galactopyranose mutase
MPFAINESTRFISPTKTPEFLAARLPVISTPIRDVVQDWGEAGLVTIAATAEDMIAGAEQLLAGRPEGWVERVGLALAATSWDQTWMQMSALIDAVPRRMCIGPRRNAARV